MRLTYLLILVSAFCITILVVINKPSFQQPTGGYEQRKLNGPEEFELFHRGIRTPEDEDGPRYQPGFIVKELQKLKALAQARNHSNARTQSNGVIEWISRGPNNVPGRTRGLLVDPDDPTKNTWFAGSAGGGVWKTTNGGVSWNLITPDLPNLATTVLAMAASNPDVIYMGTGEGFANVDRVRGHGMYKSINRGQTWIYLPTTNSFGDVNRVIIDPANGDVVVAATSTGIYKSTNGGSNWVKTSDRTFILDLKATPGNFNIQFAAQDNVGVLKSTNAGVTWVVSNSGMGFTGRVEIGISPVTPNRIFASAEGTASGSESDLYISNDAGESWNVVNVMFNNSIVDFLGGQGWYDNTIGCDPFNADILYVGGVNLFRVKLTSGSSVIGTYSVAEVDTKNFLTLINFASASHGNFQVGSSANNTSVELRFGTGKSQKAHRFLVPVGSTSGVPDASYSYTDYVTVPFEVWDITNNRQLMVSFRDQDRNGEFNLLPENTDGAPTVQSREYVYINNVTYDAQTPNSNIAINGGHVFQQMYFFWPVLAAGKTWPTSILPSQLQFQSKTISKLNAETITSTDAYNQFDGKNRFLNYGVDMHPDQHNLVMIPMSSSTYKILAANDGGVFVSNTSATPAINQGDWSMRGKTYLTSQFYGADKRPGFNEYVGGMQDNGTWKSPSNSLVNSSTNYLFNIGGDGFEVIWNNLDDKKLIGGSQGNNFARSIDGGVSWIGATSGLSGSHPFISKLANSRDNPDVIYTLSSDGVFKSLNFGQSWTLTPITEKWGGSSSFMDIEVSRGNSTIVWAGNGMSNSGTQRSIHVSTNGGASFSPTVNYTEVTLGNISKLASHPHEPSTAFALFSFSAKPKILRTKNMGQSWEDISGFGTGNVSLNGFPDVAVYCLYVRPDNPDIIWVGTEIGIVESLDNGQTWNLIDDFPNVSVWEMKGQDDQVVIATHGRGIWTATIEASQFTVTTPEIIAYGTSPNKNLLLKIKSGEAFDKIEVYESSTLLETIVDVEPSIVTIRNLLPGNKNIKLVSYRGTAPYHSKTYAIEHLDILSVETAYSTYFNSTSDLTLKLFSQQPMPPASPGERNVLQSIHPYPLNTQSIMIIRHPIKISSTFPVLQYEDIALVEPGLEGAPFDSPDFKDYVIVEATKNGLDWIPLLNGYDARFNANWLSSYSSNSNPTKSLFAHHEIDLTERFSVGDSLLIRYRLESDAVGNGWGWAINYVAIQQAPTGVERNVSIQNTLSLYPNPSNGNATLEYVLLQPSEINLQIVDGSGRTVLNQNLGRKIAGKHKHMINLANEKAGAYHVKIRTNSGEKTTKLIMLK